MGITDADVEAGLDFHARLGAGDLKHRTEISPANLFKKATAYWTFKLNQQVEPEAAGRFAQRPSSHDEEREVLPCRQVVLAGLWPGLHKGSRQHYVEALHIPRWPNPL